MGFKTIKTIKLEDWKWLIISGIVGSFIPAFFFAIAETKIDSAVVSVLNSLVPLNTILLSFAVFKITSTKSRLLGVVIGFVGTAILILKGSDLNPNQNYFYVIFVILSTIMYAINVNIIKKYLQHIKPLTIATGNFVAFFIPAIIVLLFIDFFSEETFNQPNFKMAVAYITILSFFWYCLG